MINIGLIGFGYWGPNLARNFSQNPNMQLASVCDFSPDRQAAAKKLYPWVEIKEDPFALATDPNLDAVAVATPVSTHYDFARTALKNGKHVWLEKPMTEKVEQAEALNELAATKGKVILVDHTFVYTGAVRKIKEVVDSGDLGDLIYYDSVRINLGLFQQDVDVIWDLAPHDISIMDYLMPVKKHAVSATGSKFYMNGIVPKSFLTVYMDNNIVAHINVSWVSPVKIRQTLVGGTAKMVLYDDTNVAEKVKIYDKGVDLYNTKESLYKLKVQYRVGDMYCPKIDEREALSLATEHFVECIQNGTEPVTGGRAGLEVVKVLVASKESLKQNGTPINI